MAEGNVNKVTLEFGVKVAGKAGVLYLTVARLTSPQDYGGSRCYLTSRNPPFASTALLGCALYGFAQIVVIPEGEMGEGKIA